MYSVILYQMGKVGSSTLKESLKHQNIKPLHIHRYYFKNNEKPIGLRRFIHKVKSNIIFNRFIRNKRVKVITFYRDPLARNISSFFQNLDVYFSKTELETLSFEILERKFIGASNLHKSPNNWFDIEFNKKLRVDIFKNPFDKEKGFGIFKKNNIDFFVCTTNKINSLEKEFGRFLEIEDFKIINKNIGSKKWYNHLYKEFKEKYKPSATMLDSLYNSKTIRHFYSEEDIVKFKKSHQ